MRSFIEKNEKNNHLKSLGLHLHGWYQDFRQY